jgi:hypothetical protein
MEYKVIYDFANEQIRLWPILAPACALLLGIGAFLQGLLSRRPPQWRRRFNMAIGLIFCVFSIWCGMLVIPYNISEYNSSREALREDKCKSLEGVIKDFMPCPEKGRAVESFVLNGVKFEYLPEDRSYYGYTRDRVEGEKLENGQQARLLYFTDKKGRNIILKLEIAERK